MSEGVGDTAFQQKKMNGDTVCFKVAICKKILQGTPTLQDFFFKW